PPHAVASSTERARLIGGAGRVVDLVVCGVSVHVVLIVTSLSVDGVEIDGARCRFRARRGQPVTG
ncbi:MAG: hypothetical protein WBP59_07945, partial [Ilumatobacteraceae bacterium]